MNSKKSARDKWSHRYQEVLRLLMVESLWWAEEAEECAERLANLVDAIQPAFDHWIETGSFEKAPEVLGFTVQRLLDERHAVGVPNAFLWLDGLVRHGEELLPRLPKPLSPVRPLPYFIGQYHH